jgi:hypothetical protein
MTKFLNTIISKYPLAFLAVGCASVVMGVTLVVPLTDLKVPQDEYQHLLRLVLLVFGLLLITGAFVIAMKDVFWPPQPAGTKPVQPAINPRPYGIVVKTPVNGSTVEAPVVIKGRVRKTLPKHLELWLMHVAGTRGAERYWPDKTITVEDDNWTFPLDTQGARSKKIGIYIVGENGQALIQCFKHVNKYHVDRSPQHQKLEWGPMPRLTPDIVEVCQVEFNIKEPKAVP